MSRVNVTKLDEFIDAFRKRSFCFRLDELWLEVPEVCSFLTKGQIYSESDVIYMSFIFPEGIEDVVGHPISLWKDSVCFVWKGRGVISDHIEVCFPKLFVSQWEVSGDVIKYTIPVELIETLDVHLGKSVSFHQRIDSKSLIYKNEKTIVRTEHNFFKHQGESSRLDSWMGEFEFTRFLFREFNGQLELDLILDSEKSLLEVEEQIAWFESISLAFSWLNRTDPYAWLTTYSNDGRSQYKLHNEFKIEKTHPSPLNYALHYDDRPRELLRLSSLYLYEGNAKDQIKSSLWHFRNVTSSETIQRTNILGLCVLLEGLVHTILLKHFNFSKSQVTKKWRAYSETERGRKKVTRPVKEKFKIACRCLRIKWKDGFEEHFKIWKNVRNKLAHGEIDQPYEQDLSLIFHHHHHLTTAYNVLLVKLFGYDAEISILPPCATPGVIR